MASNADADVVEPESLVINLKQATFVGKKGEIWLSGGKLWFSPDGTATEVITSAN